MLKKYSPALRLMMVPIVVLSACSRNKQADPKQPNKTVRMIFSLTQGPVGEGFQDEINKAKEIAEQGIEEYPYLFCATMCIEQPRKCGFIAICFLNRYAVSPDLRGARLRMTTAAGGADHLLTFDFAEPQAEIGVLDHVGVIQLPFDFSDHGMEMTSTVEEKPVATILTPKSPVSLDEIGKEEFDVSETMGKVVIVTIPLSLADGDLFLQLIDSQGRASNELKVKRIVRPQGSEE